MATFSKVQLSGSVSGRPIALTAVFTPIHTVSAVIGVLDELWLWTNNMPVPPQFIELRYAGAQLQAFSAFAQSTSGTSPPGGSIVILPGIPLSGGILVEARITLGIASIMGYVNRITP